MPSMDGGGAFQRTPDGRYRRICQRGSTEYLRARSSGLAEPVPAVLVPATEAAVEEAEHVLGLPLPPLLRRLHLEVGNGGSGSGQGILGLAGDHRGRTALDGYAQQQPRRQSRYVIGLPVIPTKPCRTVAR